MVRALKALGTNAHTVGRGASSQEMTTGTSNGTTYKGRLQLIDNQVDARSGTVRVRAVFANPHGDLMPGQFARGCAWASPDPSRAAADQRTRCRHRSEQEIRSCGRCRATRLPIAR